MAAQKKSKRGFVSIVYSVDVYLSYYNTGVNPEPIYTCILRGKGTTRTPDEVLGAARDLIEPTRTCAEFSFHPNEAKNVLNSIKHEKHTAQTI